MIFWYELQFTVASPVASHFVHLHIIGRQSAAPASHFKDFLYKIGLLFAICGGTGFEVVLLNNKKGVQECDATEAK